MNKPRAAKTQEPLDSRALLAQLVAIPGPPGAEGAVRAAIARLVEQLGLAWQEDQKGNLCVTPGKGRQDDARILVTAHLDEIGLMVQRLEPDGRLRVAPLGGAHPWKWGEQPVVILAPGGPINGALSVGCIHTASPAAATERARRAPLDWDDVRVFTGRTALELQLAGVRPGTRVALHPERRGVMEMREHIAAHFIDDRADLVSWLLALESLRGSAAVEGVVFAATSCEEVGGEGARYLMQRMRPDVCIALEIGPTVPESPFYPDRQPTIWVTDSYSSTGAADLEMLAEVCAECGLHPHWQALSRGGSDASCAAAEGLCARPITLGLPVENSHGYEIMHRDAMTELSRLLVALLARLAEPPATPRRTTRSRPHA